MFPQFSPFELPTLVSIESVDWKKAALDLAFCALPHATTQKVISDLLAKAPKTKVVDLSADFRLHDTAAYARWYGHEHHAPKLQRRGGLWPGRGAPRQDQEGAARRQSRLLHELRAACADAAAQGQGDRAGRDRDRRQVRHDRGGRAAKEEMLFSEVSEGFHAYGVGITGTWPSSTRSSRRPPAGRWW